MYPSNVVEEKPSLHFHTYQDELIQVLNGPYGGAQGPANPSNAQKQ